MIARSEGRVGESQEYVEFEVKTEAVTWTVVAQKSDRWFVFLADYREGGGVRTVGQSADKLIAVEIAEAVAKALDYALDYEYEEEKR